MDKLDKLGVSPKDREYLEKEMAKAGFGLDVDRTRRAVNWGLVNGYYAYPVAYNHGLIHLQEDIQERIQTLILGDLGNVSDDATPPKYQELVNQYYEVLSRSGKPAPAGKAAPAKATFNDSFSHTAAGPVAERGICVRADDASERLGA